MASGDIKQAWKMLEPTLRRLPWYLTFVKLMKGKGEVFISSTQTVKEISVNSSQVAKDLSLMSTSGKTGVGYDTNALVDVLEDLLGSISQHKAFPFGVGSLGASLLHGTGLSQYGLEIVAGFDVREDLDGSMINGIPIFHMNGFPAKQKEYGATIGAVTMPVKKAQEVIDRVIEGGIKALWSFIPFHIWVPEHIVVQNIPTYAYLAVMFNRLNPMNY